jgi:nicotinamide-nucleotide adenylyltransferase
MATAARSSTADRYETGVIHGRFQVLHNDHLAYLLAGKAQCDHLVIGITNPDPEMTCPETADTRRNNPLSNPLTYYERYRMIRAVMIDAQIPESAFSIVPFPINLPERYRYYVPLDAVFFLTIYDDWGRQKKRYFHSLSLQTHVLWEVPLEKKGISASDIRRAMIQGDDAWTRYVPESAAALLLHWDIIGRLRRLHDGMDLPRGG